VGRLREIVRRRPPLTRGQSLFRGAERRDFLYIVRSGCLRTSIQTHNGGEQIVGFHLPGGVVGFDTGLGPFDRCRATALERTSVCAVSVDDLHRLATRVPGLQEQVYRLVSREIVANRQHLLIMSRPTARQRLALFLHTWSWRMRASGFTASPFTLPMRREDIANYLGVALETTSRAISRLHQDGVIRARGRRIELLRPELLGRIADCGVDATAA